jgi:hypothetical protein
MTEEEAEIGEARAICDPGALAEEVKAFFGRVRK